MLIYAALKHAGTSDGLWFTEEKTIGFGQVAKNEITAQIGSVSLEKSENATTGHASAVGFTLKALMALLVFCMFII